jgi:hypothetical protein
LAADDRSKQHVKADRLILEHLKAYLAMHAAEFEAQYDEAARRADAMWGLRAELEKLSPFYCTTKHEIKYLVSGETYWGLGDRKRHYLLLDDMLNGRTGTVVALAPREAKFKLDPGDLGRFEQWYLDSCDRSGWQLADTCKPFYLQAPNGLDKRGMPYQGAMWYAFELKVPAAARGKTVKLYSPIVVDDAWVWMNGSFVGHRGHLDPYIRPAPIEYDVTNLIQPGKPNVIAVRVHTGLCPTAVADGFMGRLFLYAPAAK